MTDRMRKMLQLVCAAALLGTAGCGSGKEQPEAAASGTPAPPPPAQPASEGRADDVLVTVNGAELTRGAAEQQAAQRLRAVQSQMQPGQLESMRPRMLAYVLDQFIIRSLLLQEADRLNITATDEDVDKELETIATQLPPGVTVEQIMKESAVGEAQMREEIVTKVRVDKLMATRSPEQEVTDADVEAFYAEHGDRLNVPENVHARHILIAVEEGDDEAIREAKRAKADDLRKELEEGADFAQLAERHSNCPSKEMGGDLGRFRRGQMVPAFDEVAFSLAVSNISPVVETEFGYHIIQVLEHSEESRVPRENVVAMIRNGRQREQLSGLVQELKANATIEYAPDAPRLPEQTPMPMAAPSEENEATAAEPQEAAQQADDVEEGGGE